MRAWGKGPACQLETARRYTRAFPKRSDGWIVLADGLGGVARYPEAQVALRQAAQFIPENRRWFLAVQWGHLYREKRDEKRAEAWYRRALALHPSTGTHIFVGATLAKQGRFAEAMRHHQRAIALAKDPKADAADEAYYNLGLILRAREKYAQAATALKQALRIDPKYKLAREALKDVEEAIRLRNGAG
jgi:tetratricopeptide (TPR) repeat protein